MLPTDLAGMLQTILLAMAFGCGAPALIYLAFHGNLRLSKEQFTTMKKEENLIPVKIETPQPDANKDIPQLSQIDWEKVYANLPVKGYVYVPKPVLMQAIKEFLAEDQRRSEALKRLVQGEKAEEAPAKSAEKKPKPQVRRIPP